MVEIIECKYYGRALLLIRPSDGECQATSAFIILPEPASEPDRARQRRHGNPGQRSERDAPPLLARRHGSLGELELGRLLPSNPVSALTDDDEMRL